MTKSILVTNDDGIHSTGLHALADALRELGEVTIVAPDREKSAASHALTLRRPVALQRIDTGIYTVDGTPADCVYLGALQVLKQRPDLVAAGINRGVNIGDDVTYSGTVAAAFEGTILGVPSIAISQMAQSNHERGSCDGVRFRWDTSVWVARRIADRVFSYGLPDDILLNINVPADPVLGVRCTRQGKHLYDQAVQEAIDPRGRITYWVGSGEPTVMEQSEDTDYTSVHNGYVSITPLHLDLTHRRFLERIQRDWEPDIDAEFRKN